MIIYNYTVKVDPHIADDWLNWCYQDHIPEVIATGCFYHARILKMLDTDFSDGTTFTIQFSAESKGQYNFYIEKFSIEIQQKSVEKWGDHLVSFSSVMQVINECA